MKKINSYLNIILVGLGVLFFIPKNVFAATPSYSFGFEAYNVSEACNLETEDGAWDCWVSLVLGDLADYKIIDNQMTKNEKIMVVLKSESLENSDIAVLKLTVPVDTTKLNPYEYSIYNTDTTREDWGIYPAIRKGTSYITNWQPTMAYSSSKNWWTLNTYDDKIGMADFKPLVTPGYLAAMFFEVKSDISPGDEIEFKYHYVANDDPNASLEEKQLVTISNEAYEEEKQYGTYNSLKLSMASSSSNINTLDTLTATGNNGISYPFGFVPASKDNMEYSFTVPNAVSNIKLEGTPTDATIKGATGLINIAPAPSESNPNPSVDSSGHNLEVGKNEVYVTITSAQGSVAIYKLTINRLSNDTKLTSVTGTNGVAFATKTDGFIDSLEASNTISVPYSVADTTITANLNDPSATLEFTPTWTLNTDHNNNTKNTFTIKVKAEDCKYNTTAVPGNVCTEETYHFAINREAPSKDVSLSNLKIEDLINSGELLNETNPTKDDFNITTPANTSKIKVTATPNDSKSTVTVLNTNSSGENLINVGENTITVNVTSEAGANGITKSYTIHVKRLSNETKLKSLNVTSNPIGTFLPTFNANLDVTVGKYTYTYPSTVSSIEISATVEDTDKAYVSILDKTKGETVNDTNKKLNTSTKTVGIDTKEVSIIVTGENGDTREYAIDLTKTKSTDNALKSLSISNGTIKETFQPNITEYTAEVEANVDSVTVTAIPRDEQNATVTEITGNTNLQFGSNNKIYIRVKAENDSIQTYTITITRKESNIAFLDDLKIGFDNNTPSTISGFHKDTISYTLYNKTNPLPYETNTINIEYTKGMKMKEYLEILE